MKSTNPQMLKAKIFFAALNEPALTKAYRSLINITRNLASAQTCLKQEDQSFVKR